MIQKFKNLNSGQSRVSQEQQQNKIFCEEVREFIKESRKNQTVYANFEGHHERIVERDNFTQLDNLVFLTLSNGKDRASLTPEEFSQTDTLTKLMVGKILNSLGKYNLSVIRLKVVWVYYFDYVKDEMRSMPVFKLYKRSEGSEALYIDITASGYECWDHFIMFGMFPVSFICVPRGGEYTFRSIDGEELLDLEYVCKNSALLDSHRNIRPVSQVLIRPMLKRLEPYVEPTRRVLQFAMDVASLLDLQRIPEVGCVLLFVGGVVIILRVLEMMLENESERALESAARDYGLVLLNENAEEPFCWLKPLNLISEGVERPLQSTPFIDFIKRLQNPEIHLVDILKYMPAIFEISEFLYLALVGMERTGTNESLIRKWISFFEYLSVTWKKTSGNTREIAPRPSGNYLNSLENYSCERVLSMLEASRGTGSNEGTCNPSLHVSHPHQSGLDIFGFRVFLLVGDESPDCGGFLQTLLKSSFTLRNGNSFQEITRCGRLIGIVIPFSVRSKNLAVVAVRLDALNK